ncbi:hypothetical protein [Chitinophaga agri]|uniref:Uncharacterized protein n=1 Tax=Chitinophaga agri TaxID=2703787 RepID=A0A6B9ZMN4_9BACT|nr:hypothetical protein [Chitinophaga agri]QHS63720.1 hypothetical protein GWR21_30305 [Chitinophaga agri]
MARPYLETIDVIRWGYLIQEGHPVNDTVDATTTLPFTLATCMMGRMWYGHHWR